MVGENEGTPVANTRCEYPSTAVIGATEPAPRRWRGWEAVWAGSFHAREHGSALEP